MDLSHSPTLATCIPSFRHAVAHPDESRDSFSVSENRGFIKQIMLPGFFPHLQIVQPWSAGMMQVGGHLMFRRRFKHSRCPVHRQESATVHLDTMVLANIPNRFYAHSFSNSNNNAGAAVTSGTYQESTTTPNFSATAQLSISESSY